jgi:hypothetical protein
MIARMVWAMMTRGERYKEPNRAGGLNKIAPAIRRDVTVGKGKQHVMQSQSIQ